MRRCEEYCKDIAGLNTLAELAARCLDPGSESSQRITASLALAKDWSAARVKNFPISVQAYSDAVRRQTSESFLRSLENAFRHFGAVTATVVIDNLKAGGLHANGFDPELTP